MDKDFRTQSIVLRRTNYGEADRVLNIITPKGKLSVIAKGVRKPRSKLAGGIEMLSLSELQIHTGRSELGIVTSARMIRHYDGILKSYEKMEFSGLVLKKISKQAEHTDSVEWFEITKQVLENLNVDVDLLVVKIWFFVNMLRVSGEEINLYRDANGDKLLENTNYDWDIYEKCFVKNINGQYGTNEIKLLRLVTKMKLDDLKIIKIEPDVITRVYDIIKIWEN